MTRTLGMLGIVFLAFGMNLAVVGDADARRLGGGRTLGGKSAFQRSAQPRRTPSEQAAFNRNQQARQQLAQRGGVAGLLGGLAIGGLLGALFFGGAFENVNLLDLLVFGGIAWLAFRLLASRRRAGPQGAPDGPRTAALAGDDADLGRPREQAEPAARGDGLLFGLNETTRRPADFDERAFLDGARRAFEILQRGWNDGDLSEIRALTTDAMFAALQEQLREPNAESFVQVLEVDARILDAREVNGVQEATVLFDSVLREHASERPAQVREIWHFTRTAGAVAPTWFLDGIEQMRD